MDWKQLADKEMSKNIRKAKIKLFFRSFLNIHYKIMDLVSRVKLVVSWLPVIWRDREFDEGYIYIILHKKLDRMADFYQSDNTYAEGADKVASQIIVIRDALGRLIEDDYYAEACDKWGYDDGLNLKGEFSSDEMIKIINTPKTDEQRELALKVYDYEEELRMNDIKLVFSEKVSSQIRGWWD